MSTPPTKIPTVTGLAHPLQVSIVLATSTRRIPIPTEIELALLPAVLIALETSTLPILTLMEHVSALQPLLPIHLVLQRPQEMPTEELSAPALLHIGHGKR